MTTERLTVGNLVRWLNGVQGNIGTVADVASDGRRLTVHFDDGDEMTFSAPTDVLARVLFDDGAFVETRGDGTVGVVQSGFDRDGLRVYQINLPSGNSKIVPEGSLRPGVITDPIAMLRAGQLDPARSVNLRVAATRLLFSHQFDDLSSLSNSRVEIKPHQVSVLHRVASSYPHRFLLADEVGLGKTIEAGLIIKELKARGVANRVLVLAPSGIVSQWQYELRTKFNEAFSHYTPSTIDYLQSTHPGENVWAVNDNVIASSTYASWTENRRRDIALAGWDLIIVDEAHHVRRTYQGDAKSKPTNLYQLVSSLADPEHGHSRGLLLLTATPMQLHRFELYSLVELLDPTLFASYRDFDEHADAVAALNRVVDDVQRWDETDDHSGVATQVAGWLEGSDVTRGNDRWLTGEEATTAAISAAFKLIGRENPFSDDTASPLVLAGMEARLAEPASRAGVLEILRRRHRLSEVLIRNRKAVVGGFMPRVAVVWPVDMTDSERAAYDAATEYVRTGYERSRATRNNALGFVMAVFQKLNSSSSYALRQSLLRRIEKLEALSDVGRGDPNIEEEDLDELPVEDALGDWIAARPNDVVADELAELRSIVELIDEIELDSKARVLIDRLAEIAAREPSAKVLLFTQFRDTQSYIARVAPADWGVNLFHGQLKPQEKDAAVGRFRDGNGPQILVSTEAGGEGRNFQFAHMLINYDLPWNPMKIEQRIGRLDRIGQRHPVTVINFSMVGTIEERVLAVLSQRIRVFEETIGGLDPILGEIEQDLRKVFLAAEAEGKRALEILDRHLESRVREARNTERQLADLIMDAKSFRQDEVRALLERRGPLDTKAIQRFVLGALTELGVEVSRDQHLDGVFQLKLRGQFANEFPQFGRESNSRRVTFDPAVALDYESIEFMAFGHELVDALVGRVRARNYPGRASIRVIRTDDAEPTRGWFFVFVLEFEGVVASKELLAIFTDGAGLPHEHVAAWLLDRAMSAKREDWDGYELPPRDQAFDTAAEFAKSEAIRVLLDRQALLTAANRERLEQERTKLERFYEYKAQAAQEKLKAVMETFDRLSLSSDPDVQRILPVWAKNVENARLSVESNGADRDARLATLGRRSEVSASHELLAASWVEIVPDGATPKEG